MQVSFKYSLPIICSLFFISCGGNNTDPYVNEPGQPTSNKKKLLEVGADVMQNKAPVNAINMYLDGFHFYNGHINSQMEAHHYCTVLNEDVTQCIVYDGNGKDAHIMGIEYIVSAKLFSQMPNDEKLLWHSHNHEVKSGSLIAPGIPIVAEHELMEKMISTYGKTWHTWHTDKDKVLPYGSPQLMMGFTKDGQLQDSVLQRRDQNFNVNTLEKRRNREDIPDHKILNGADAWQQGKVKQLPSLSAAHQH